MKKAKLFIGCTYSLQFLQHTIYCKKVFEEKKNHVLPKNTKFGKVNIGYVGKKRKKNNQFWQSI